VLRKDCCTTNPNPSFFAKNAGFFALSAAFVFSFSATIQAQKLFGNTATINPSGFSWLSKIDLKLQQTASLERGLAQVPEFKPVVSMVDASIRPISVRFARKSSRKALIELAATIQSVEVPPEFKYEAPKVIITERVIYSNEAPAIADQEAQILQNMHAMLHTQFVTAANPIVKLNTQLAFNEVKNVKTKQFSDTQNSEAISAARLITEVTTPTIQAAVTTPSPSIAKLDVTPSEKQWVAKAYDNVKPAIVAIRDVVRSSSAHSEEIAEFIEEPTTVKPVAAKAHKFNSTAPTLNTHFAQYAPATTYNSPERGQFQPLIYTPPKLSTQPIAPSTQLAKLAQRALDALASTQAATHPSEFESKIPSLVREDSPYVEALDPASSAIDASSRILAGEWKLSKSPNHWSTLAWNTYGPTPLISVNTAHTLGTVASASVQNNAGIVFGKIQAGWNIEFSARTEHPLFFNSTYKPIPADQNQSERYFVYLNVAPGSQILYVTNREGSQGAVAVPVMESVSTYVELTQISHMTIRGRVLDASGEAAPPLAGVSVKVIGQTSAMSATTTSGSFEIQNVTRVGTYPLFFETDLNHEYTHRYQVKTEITDLSHLVFYRLSGEQIQSWVGQLEGGLSAESGLAVAALPQTVAQNVQTPLMPVVAPLGTDATLIPETYIIASDGQLKERVPLSDSSRFISVQVPEGASIAQLEDKSQRSYWSELFIASPGVINILGPN